jgi:hypothetical protein
MFAIMLEACVANLSPQAQPPVVAKCEPGDVSIICTGNFPPLYAAASARGLLPLAQPARDLPPPEDLGYGTGMPTAN